MNKTKRIGIILILIGACLPLVFLALASPYYHEAGLIPNIQSMEITIWEGPVNIYVYPYKYIFAFGVVLVCTGIGFATLSKNKTDK